MPRLRPATTGYERLAQADHSDDSDDEDPLAQSYASLQAPSAPRYAPISQPRPKSGMATPAALTRTYSTSHPKNRRQRMRSNSGVDLKAINARLERWADEIASKFKRSRGKGRAEEERLEIHHSVFQPPEGVRPITSAALALPQPGVMTKNEFDVIVDSVKVAMEQGVHPRMIAQGSSGSYFARNSEGKVVAVFKPKDEEPYAAGNPKWNKWIHRNLFPCCFGRACLIPNLSYVSEAAAYTLDCQLRTNLVPYTDVVYLSSKSFHYPFWDRHSFSRKRKPLPEKPGSFQVFLKGFKDANIFLREHPWPDQYLSGFRTNDNHRKKRRRWADCRPRTRAEADGDSDEEDNLNADLPPGPDNFVWTDTLKQSFREELEKLVILDYIMRNTDRGLDNWMVRVDWSTQQVSITSEPMRLNVETEAETDDTPAPRPVDLSQRTTNGTSATKAPNPYRSQRPMAPTNTFKGSAANDPLIAVGAIDNSLSWPWKHPDAWRSFPFGWLFLPVDLIGRPFSQKTREHFLPLLTSRDWWSETQHNLRKVFMMDKDFKERMFAKQVAVMKGQAWNVVETLKTVDHGPLELTRRAKVCVWDDLVDIPVAVPMRAASEEMRRRVDGELGLGGSGLGLGLGAGAMIDEMDIVTGAASATATGTAAAPPADDLLGIATAPPGDLPNPGRFEISSASTTVPQSPTGSMMSVEHAMQQAEEPLPPQAATLHGQQQGKGQQRPKAAAGRHSYQGAGRSLNMYSPPRVAARPGKGRRGSGGGSIAQQLHGRSNSSGDVGIAGVHSSSNRPYYYEEDEDEDEDITAGGSGGGYGNGHGGYGGGHSGMGGMMMVDELEAGDLGYAAAEGMEGQRRKVIVERLEMVKSRNPVFTWC